MATFLIIGPGAVGVGLAALLHEQGLFSVFWGRHGPEGRKFRFDGLNVSAEIDIDAATMADANTADAVFVAVKAFDLENALETSLAKLPEGVPIIPICNGAIEGIVARFAARYPSLLWRLGYCTFGITEVEPGHFAMRSQRGAMVWGPVAQSNDAMLPTDGEQLLIQRSDRFQWRGDILYLVRRKWLFNVAINSLAAKLRLPRNGDLLAHEPMLREVFSEGYRLGVSLWGRWRESEDAIFDELLKLIRDTRDNENSMARDVRLRRRTESEYLAGMAAGRPEFPLLNALHTAITSS